MSEVIEKIADWKIAEAKKPKTVRQRGCCFSINRRGEISMNNAAWEKLLNHPKVVLLYNPARNSIGIKAAWGYDKQAFAVKKHGRGRRTPVIRAWRLFRQFGVTVEETLYFKDMTPALLGSSAPMFVLDLGQPATFHVKRLNCSPGF